MECYETEEWVNVSVYHKAMEKARVRVESISRQLIVYEGTREIARKEMVKPFTVGRVSVGDIKIEIILHKVERGRWQMEDERPAEWRKSEVDVEEGEEVYSNDQILNMFKKVYNSSTEETKRAMNKSFVESGGSVLSTNWKDVSKEKYGRE